jgi:2-keto-3-deoxy-galactonokinase
VLWNAQGFTARGVRYTRQGWKAVVPLVAVPAGAQGLAVAIVAYVKGYSEVFAVPGWEFGSGWWSAVGAAVVSAWIGNGLGWAAWRERVEGYQLLPGEAED